MVAESLQKQIVLGMQTADMSQQCTDALIGELIKSHNRRDMDHILNSIPTFNGLEPEKCVDWVMRIRNASEQLNKDFRQEPMNKSELMVQNFIKGLGTDILDDEIMNRILGLFSDIPTPYHAMDKIKSIRTYIECLERKAVNNNIPYTDGTLHECYKSSHSQSFENKHPATSVGDAMKKAEECYLKDIYAQAGLEKDREQGNA